MNFESIVSAENTFYSIEEAIKTPGEVLKLDLHFKGLNEFPNEILKFQELEELILWNNHIETILYVTAGQVLTFLVVLHIDSPGTPSNLQANPSTSATIQRIA